MSLLFDALRKAELFRIPRPTREDSPTISVVTNPAPVVQAAPGIVEHRKQKRAKVSMGVRLRSANVRDGDFKEVLKTSNVSRLGIYFVTSAKHYHLHMWLRVVFPYVSAQDTFSSEQNAEVVRLEELANGKMGVALFLHGSAKPATSDAGVVRPSRVSGKERRVSRRHWFSATALVIDAESDTQLKARCSDLSLKGCYIDTLNPFHEGTGVLVRLTNSETQFQCAARTTRSNVGMGMGLEFANLTPEQESVLLGWLPTEHDGPVVISDTFSG